MTISRRWWVQPTLFGLALSGLLINLVLHLATFDAPTLSANLRWLAVGYPCIVTGPPALISLFSFIRTMRLSSAPPPPNPRPSRSAIAQALRVEFRAAPPFARAIYGLVGFLCGYLVLLIFQMCALLSTLKPEGYYIHYWSVLGMLNYLMLTLQAANALGWWGWWRARR